MLSCSLCRFFVQVSEAIKERKEGELIHKRMKGMVADSEVCVKELKEQRHSAYLASGYILLLRIHDPKNVSHFKKFFQ